MLECITINLSAGKKVRREMLHGRPHLVVHATLLVPGVLNGSMGPLYYPLEEVEKDFFAWNHMPIVVYHPRSKAGHNISARDPAVLNEHAIGVVLRAQVDNKLVAELWFDENKTKQVDKRVYDAVVNGQPMELSTGLFTENYAAPKGAKHNGKAYTFVARNYKPDHLAILPDQIGACSLNDGCGLHVNACKCGGTCGSCKAGNTNPGVEMKKSAMVAFLAANTTAWKGQEKLLNTFTDEHLKALVGETRVAVSNTAVINCMQEVYELEDGELTPDNAKEVITKNAKKKTPEEIAAEEEDAADGGADDAEENPDGTKKKKPMNKKTAETNSTGKKTYQQWMAEAPPEIQAVVNSAKRLDDAKRNELATKLVGNVKDKAKKTVLFNKYVKMTVPDLEELVDLMVANSSPAKQRRNDEDELDLGDLPNFGGLMPVSEVTDNSSDEDLSDEEIVLPVRNQDFSKMVKEERKQQSAVAAS